MSQTSIKYNNLKYAIETLCDVIESCEIEKVVNERYLPQLEKLVDDIVEVKKELAKKMSDIDDQKIRWTRKIKQLQADAILDDTLSEDLKERILVELKRLEQKVATHGDS